MKKTPIHKTINPMWPTVTYCNTETGLATMDWKKVTCKKCIEIGKGEK